MPEPYYAPNADDASAADGAQGQPGEDFGSQLSQLDDVLRRHKAVQRTLLGRQAMLDAQRPQQPPPPSQEEQKAQKLLTMGAKHLAQQGQQMQSALKAAMQNMDPVQKAALALKLHQNALATASGHDTSDYLDMPLDRRSALISSTYGPGGGSLGDPFGGAAKILASLGPNAQMPRSTLDIYHEMQARRPHKVVINIHHGAPASKETTKKE